jgi:hypothetical protein
MLPELVEPNLTAAAGLPHFSHPSLNTWPFSNFLSRFPALFPLTQPLLVFDDFCQSSSELLLPGREHVCAGLDAPHATYFLHLCADVHVPEELRRKLGPTTIS